MTYDEFTPMEPEQIQQLEPVTAWKRGKGPVPPPPPPVGFYATGPTTPPKERTGLVVMVLLILVLLGGIFATLMMLNIRFLDVGSQMATSFAHGGSVSDGQSGGPSLISIQDGGQELSLQQIYSANIDSVVSVTAGEGRGSGVILTNDGYLVTSYQVVSGGGTIRVLLNDGREFSARLVGQDEVTDLAVLQVNATNLIPATFGDSDQTQVGDTVVSIGDPLGITLRGTFTDGMISAINRDITVDGAELTVLQTSAARDSGNWGGPLINCYGQIIGINTAHVGSLDTGDATGIGLAIPSNVVAQITDQLISQGYVTGRPVLGFDYEDLGALTQAYLMISGIYVTDVAADSDAYTVGLRSGDVILSIDALPLTCAQDLDAYKANLSPGDEITLIVYRSGKEYTATIQVGGAE